MSTSKYLALLATAFETQAGASTTANATPPGYWKRIAAAAEVIAGAVTTANAGLTGYAKRAVAAVVAKTSFAGSGYNENEEGYLAKLVAALEFATSTTTTGSMESRLNTLLGTWSPGGGGGAAAALNFSLASNSQYTSVLAF